MTNEQILNKVIEKAKENGYEFEYNIKSSQYNFYYYAYIFSHDFAKAFWGEKDRTPIIAGRRLLKEAYPEWQYHLQQMVLEEEPLKYLEKLL